MASPARREPAAETVKEAERRIREAHERYRTPGVVTIHGYDADAIILADALVREQDAREGLEVNVRSERTIRELAEVERNKAQDKVEEERKRVKRAEARVELLEAQVEGGLVYANDAIHALAHGKSQVAMNRLRKAAEALSLRRGSQDA